MQLSKTYQNNLKFYNFKIPLFIYFIPILLSSLFAQDVLLYFGELDTLNKTIEIRMENEVQVDGGQFNLSDNPDNINLVSATGGVLEEFWFTTSFNAEGIILFFEFMATSSRSIIPPGDHLLTIVEYEFINPTNQEYFTFCLEEGIFTNNGSGTNIEYGNCMNTEIPEAVNFNISGLNTNVYSDNCVRYVISSEHQISEFNLEITGVELFDAQIFGWEVGNYNIEIENNILTAIATDTLNIGSEYYASLNLYVDTSSFFEICVTNSQFYNSNGNLLNSNNPDCRNFDPSGVHLTWGTPNLYNNTIDINMILPISLGFIQFNYSGIEVVSLSDGLGNWYLNYVVNHEIIGFWDVDEEIPATEGVLTTITFAENEDSWLCMDDHINFSLDGEEVQSANGRQCVFLSESGIQPGDNNLDSVIDVIDVLLAVNVILDNETPNVYMDLDGDGIVNVIDILKIVDIILDN